MLRGRFTFNSAQHEYRVGRYLVPGISEILRAAGIVQDRHYGQTSRTRGSVVHELIEAADLGLLALENVAGPVRGWCLAYAAAVRDLKPTHEVIEGAVVHRGFGYATTIDRAGTLLGRRATWNVKTGPAAAWHGIQRAAEALALDGRISRRARFTLYIRPSGRYSVEEHTNAADFEDFLDACLQWRRGCHQERLHGPLRLVDPLLGAEARLKQFQPRSRNRSPLSRRSA